MSKTLRALGLMSGTSMDGIDVAMIETDGEAVVAGGPSRVFPYEPWQREILKQAIVEAKAMQNREARPGSLRDAERQLTEWHANAVHSFLQEWKLTDCNIDIIGFHGQTVIHRPERHLTVQLGSGEQLARAIGIPVVYDMRAADVSAGGQGAPLVPAYHAALAGSLGAPPVAFLNIGGVANLTWIGPEGNLIAFDTGPGNALIDDWMVKKTGKPRDEGGQLALSGQVDEAAAGKYMQSQYFDQPYPKSLDRNSFDLSPLEGAAPQDGVATLSNVTARCVAAALRWLPSPPRLWVVCGGGRHNAAVMKALRDLLPGVTTAEDHGFNGDALEAEAWAYLAVRSLKGLPLTFPGTTGVAKAMSGGVLAKP